MKTVPLLRLFWALILIEGLAVLAALLLGAGGRPASVAVRIGLPLILCLAWVLLAAVGGWLLSAQDRAQIFSRRAGGWIRTGGRILALQAGCAALALLAFEFFLFTFMFLPAYLRGLSVWAGLFALQTWVGLRLHFIDEIQPLGPLFPRLGELEARQRKVLALLCLLGLIYFGAFIPINLKGAEDAGRFLVSGGDEVVIYPILTTMLTPGEAFRTSLYRLIEYDDYHYGYPFYALSALTIFPVRLLFGSSFDSHYPLNLVLLRQLISVLPMVLAALILTFLGTQLRSYTRSIALFALILSIPGVVSNNVRFWHPDGLTVLLVVLTLFFLTRDRLRLGRNFYLAAVCCGLAVAVRLVGFFFVLAIAGYLAAVLFRRREWGRVISTGAWFAVVMGLTILLSSPYLFDSGARGRMIAIMGQKSVEMDKGYDEPDPEGVYKTGWDAWLPFFERSFAQDWFIGFLGLSLLAGLAGKERLFPALLMAWIVMMGGYLIFFVASKAFQYLLPLFVPFYSAAFLLLAPLESQSKLWKVSAFLVYASCLVQFGINLIHVYRLF